MASRKKSLRKMVENTQNVDQTLIYLPLQYFTLKKRGFKKYIITCSLHWALYCFSLTFSLSLLTMGIADLKLKDLKKVSISDEVLCSEYGMYL